MSMPKRLLGRSRTCPLLARTSKSGPRYLLIVRALAGDSTMTRDFFFFRVATLGLLAGSISVRGRRVRPGAVKVTVVSDGVFATIGILGRVLQPPILYSLRRCQC